MQRIHGTLVCLNCSWGRPLHSSWWRRLLIGCSFRARCPAVGGGAGSCLLACYLVLWHCGTGGTVALWHMSLSAWLSLCPYEPKFL